MRQIQISPHVLKRSGRFSHPPLSTFAIRQDLQPIYEKLGRAGRESVCRPDLATLRIFPWGASPVGAGSHSRAAPLWIARNSPCP